MQRTLRRFARLNRENRMCWPIGNQGTLLPFEEECIAAQLDDAVDVRERISSWQAIVKDFEVHPMLLVEASALDAVPLHRVEAVGRHDITTNPIVSNTALNCRDRNRKMLGLEEGRCARRADR